MCRMSYISFLTSVTSFDLNSTLVLSMGSKVMAYLHHSLVSTLDEIASRCFSYFCLCEPKRKTLIFGL